MNKLESIYNNSTRIATLMFWEYPTTIIYKSNNGSTLIKEWVDCDDNENDIFLIYKVSKDSLNKFILKVVSHKELYYTAENNSGILIYDSGKPAEEVKITDIDDDYIPNKTSYFNKDESPDFEIITHYLDYNLESFNEIKDKDKKLNVIKNTIFLELLPLAEKMVCSFLLNPIPIHQANEVRDLFDKINFERHLNAHGLSFNDNEVEISLSGNGVSSGLINIDELESRLKSFANLVGRTAERVDGNDFRPKGNIATRYKAIYSPFVSIGRASSYAVTLRFLSDNNVDIDQEQIDKGNPFISYVIDETLENLELFNQDNEEKLKEKFNNSDYYQNFKSFAKTLLPDGKSIKLVGLSLSRYNKTKSYTITRERKKIDVTENIHELENEHIASKSLVVQGFLKAANDDSKKITITQNSENETYSIIVPDGMSDIVRNYWASEVVVKIKLKEGTKNTYYLEDIE